jgi:WD40 repeat protein
MTLQLHVRCTANDVMSLIFVGSRSGRLVSPHVTLETNSCLSFVVYFNSSHSVTVSLGTASKVSYFDVINATTLGLLEYPFNRHMFEAGEGSQLFRIRLMVPAGSYRVVFDAAGTEGSVHIWDIQTSNIACSRKLEA